MSYTNNPNFQYPAGLPRSLMDRLFLIAKDTATVFGHETAAAGVLVTNEVIEHVVICLAVGLQVAAHDTLHRSAKLLADPEIQAWLAQNPQRPE